MTAYSSAVIPLTITEEHDHVHNGRLETPMRLDAHQLSDEEKIARIAHHFEAIMHTMGLDLSDDSLRDTPKRVAKMYINEFFSGLNPKNKPSVSLFDNQYQYGEILIEKNIRVHSYCEHHFVPITGVAHIAYKSSGKVIGLSKLNRIVDYYSRRPQVQERLTRQIGQDLCRVLETDDVAVIIDAAHMCVSSRGIKDPHSSTITAEYSGCFKDLDQRKELLALLKISD